MKVSLIGVTPDAEEQIVHVARVSSSRKDKKAKPEGLINYLIKHSHWSPFEHATMTVEIETSKAIGIQLIRHRSFTFQEFSQRYQDVAQLDDMFESVELRRQAEDNRQSSEEVFDPHICYTAGVAAGEVRASMLVDEFLQRAESLYRNLIEVGIAREQARMILPLATKTKIYMTGSVRSWVHFLSIRDDTHAQKEIQLVAKDIKEVFKKEFPMISRALDY
tara:strand:+ start:12259 stop:12918 length:660 start_codon:yes stop_codon:yes gene_type:complete